MATILDLEAHRVETAQAAYVPGQTRNLPEPQVRIVRKADGAFVEFGNESELAFRLLWERAHGTPEDETRAWVQDWIEFHENGAGQHSAGAYWQPSEVVAG